jgi:hypothetical protein
MSPIEPVNRCLDVKFTILLEDDYVDDEEIEESSNRGDSEEGSSAQIDLRTASARNEWVKVVDFLPSTPHHNVPHF